MVAPGFYDGFAPQAPYNWISPPPQLRAGNQAPSSGQASFSVASDGRVNPGLVTTLDGQAFVSFIPGAFVAPPRGAPVTLGIKPVADFPNPGSLSLDTNVYCVSGNSTVAPGELVLVTLRFSTGVPAPAAVYELTPASEPGGEAGTWTRLDSSTSAAPFTISARTDHLGCFAGAFTGSAVKSGGGGFLFPAVAGAVVIIVVLAIIPLILRQRRDP
jgi:hypothetical protein